jgi:hypothetical protein
MVVVDDGDGDVDGGERPGRMERWCVDGGGLEKKSLMAPRTRRMVEEEDWRDQIVTLSITGHAQL